MTRVIPWLLLALLLGYASRLFLGGEPSSGAIGLVFAVTAGAGVALLLVG
jgi:hypothetical protein